MNDVRKMDGPTLSNAQAIAQFFAADGGRKITMDELRACTPDDREELGRLCKEQLAKSAK